MTTGRINQVAVRTWVGSRRSVRRRPTGPEFNGSGTTRFLEFECGGTLVNWQTFPSVLVFSGFCTEKHSHGERSPPLRLFELWYGHFDRWIQKQSLAETFASWRWAQNWDFLFSATFSSLFEKFFS